MQKAPEIGWEQGELELGLEEPRRRLAGTPWREESAPSVATWRNGERGGAGGVAWAEILWCVGRDSLCWLFS